MSTSLIRSVACEECCSGTTCPSCQRGLNAGLVMREVDTVRLVAAGCSDEEISIRMQCSLVTTRHRLGSIVRKLAIRNRTEITGWAIGHGVVDFTEIATQSRPQLIAIA